MKLRNLIDRLPADKVAHLKGGAVVALAMLAFVLIGLHVGLWAGVAAGSLGVGIGLELYQRLRSEGYPSWPDAIASALPGLVLAGGLFAAGV